MCEDTWTLSKTSHLESELLLAPVDATPFDFRSQTLPAPEDVKGGSIRRALICGCRPEKHHIGRRVS
jgi:hypothetical protein